MIFIPLFIVYIIIFVFYKIIYYNLIREDLNDILFNWKTSPIKSIQLTNENDCNYILGNYENMRYQFGKVIILTLKK